MARIVKDRVKDTSTTTGTGTITLANSPPAGYQAFSVLGNGSTTFYCIEDANGTAFEVGIGTYTGNTLARTTILESSNSDNAISLTSGTHTAFVTYPSNRSTFNDEGLSPTFTASGTITAGKPVIQNTNGTVTQVAETSESGSTPTVKFASVGQSNQSTNQSQPAMTYEATSGKYVMYYANNQNSSYPTIAIGTWSNGTITWGTAIVITSLTNQDQIPITSGDGRIYMLLHNTSFGSMQLAVGTISGNSFSQTFRTTIQATATAGQKIAYSPTQDQVIMVYSRDNGGQKGYARTASISGAGALTAIGSEVLIENTNFHTDRGALTYDPDTDRALYTSFNGAQGDDGYAWVIQASGSAASPTVAVGTGTKWAGTTNVGYTASCYDTENNKMFIAYEDSAAGAVKGIIATINAGTNAVTFAGNANIWSDHAGDYFSVAYDVDAEKITFWYRDDDNSDHLTYKTVTPSATSFTVANGAVLKTSDCRLGSNSAASGGAGRGVAVAVSDTSTNPVGQIAYASTYYATVNETNLTLTNYLGVASNSATTTNPVQINVNGSINNAQTGLTVDKDYYVTGAGLIKERTTTTTEPSANPTFARGNITTASNTSTGSITYEATSGRHVYAYKDTANSGYNTVVAGEWSNGAMAWGTPTVVASAGAGTDNGSAICAGNGAIYILYKQTGYTKMYARAATISGTAFTFGTAVDFSSGGSGHMEAAIGFDESTNYIIACYSYDDGGGSKTYLRPLTASGTALTVGSSQYPIYNSNAAAIRTNLIYDPDTSRTVLTYCDSADGDKGKSIVLQSTGSTGSPTLTVGSAVTWASQGTSANDVIYDTANNKMFVSSKFQESGTDYWKGCIGTVTGGGTNSISWTAQSIVWQPSGGNSSTFASTYDSSVNKGYIWIREDSVMKYNVITLGASSFTMGTLATLPNSTDQIIWNNHGAVYNSANGTVLGGRQYGGSTNYSQWLSAFTPTTTSTVVNGSVFAGTALSATALKLKTFPANTIVGKAGGEVTKGRAVIVEADGDFVQAGLTSTSVTNSGTASQGSLGNMGTYNQDMFAMAIAKDGVTYCFTYQNTSTQQVCKIGTRSGETITWGSELVLASGNSNSHFVSYNEEANVFLTTYTTGNLVKGTAVSFSGNTGTKGTEVTIMDLGNSSGNPSYHYQHWFDSTNKVTVCWAVGGVSGNQTNRSSAVALTLTGTSISVGTLYENTSAGGNKQKGCDVTGGKHVCYWNNSSGYPSTMTMTVTSSGAISWGTALVINSASSSFANPIYNPNYPNKVIIAGVLINSTYSYAGFNISGTSIATANFNSGAINNANSYTESGGNMGVYSNYSGNYCFVYQTYSPYNSRYNFATTTDGLTLTVATAVTTTAHGSNQFYAGACASDVDGIVVENHNDRSSSPGYYSYYCFNPTFNFTSTTESANFTVENYIGIAQETVSTNEDVKVTTISGVDANQSSLTPAQLYYVQTDGTLSTAAGSPSVVAGLATSATTVLVTRS
jgi:hypothetical protein